MATDPCPRGAAYNRPLWGFGACDDGYVASAGAVIQGWGGQCICAESPAGEEIISTGDALFGFDYDKILIAISVIVIVIAIAYLLLKRK